MNLSKAIKIKENHQRLHLDEYYSELLEADNLSIEALKRVNWHKEQHIDGYYEPLPGETQD